jgi:tripartite-type tricarboxylate transporter receptor subunit TctC
MDRSILKSADACRENVTATLEALAAAQPLAPLIHLPGRPPVTFGELHDLIREVRERLQGWGIAPGDIVAGCVQSRPQMALACAVLPASSEVPVVVENRPGASGIIGVNAVAQSAPDGYTLLIGTLSTHVLVPHASAGVTYDSMRDFVPIVNLFRSIKVLWVNASLPVRTATEWIAYAGARPAALNYASGGVGSSNHIDMELLNSATNLDVVHVPYNGPSAAIAAVASGDAQAMIVSIGTGLPLARAERIRPLVVFGDRRSPLLPNVPIASEQGLGRIDISAWIGLLGPAGTPEAIVSRINAAALKILQAPETIDWANRQGLEIIGGSPADFSGTLAADYRRWGDLIRRLAPRGP